MSKRIPVLILSMTLCLNACHTRATEDQSSIRSISPYAKLADTDVDDVLWTEGFWADRFAVCREVMIPNMQRLLEDADISHAYANFLVAAGLKEGRHRGPTWHDGDFYKWLEAVVYIYAVTKDENLDQTMDSIIELIGRVQREDGYIHTPVLIAERKQPETDSEFKNRLDFETYNMGHLMTCACMHYRATGKASLLEIARKSTDYLFTVYKTHPEKLANNAICPSHYMGIIDMYRVTKDPRYLELAAGLIEIRRLVEDGTDDNQDRIPFYEQTQAVGHAVRANYLYAGAADIYAETGNGALWKPLESLWRDVVNRKMYVTGSTGALYNGVSPDCSKDHHAIQLVHQAYGRPYQLPNLTAYNESCATAGFVFWGKRMLQLTAAAQYADMLELALYNGVLPAISLDGKDYFYTNPLCVVKEEPFEMRWSRQRQPYISCFCCPPNVVRTIAHASHYFYGISKDGLYVHLYGGNVVDTLLPDGSRIKLRQETDYPWDGTIHLAVEAAPVDETALFLRIPGWAKEARIQVNGKPVDETPEPGSYFRIKRHWQSGDQVRMVLPMPVQLIEANPLVEEVRNQVAVKRGPIVYCLESVDLPDTVHFTDIAIRRNQQFSCRYDQDLLHGVVVLEGNAGYRKTDPWNNSLYRELSTTEPGSLDIRLIPYYAWGNRGKTEMTVWMPLE